MRRKLAPVLALCALVSSHSVSRAQNGPDNDPDAAPGYANSVFRHGPVDSINLYNGALTIPIAVGPSYPVGPKLRFQTLLTYNSTVWEFGNPGPDNQSDVGLYEPIKADPSLGVGWTLTAGAIKPCGVVQNSQCYFGPDGSQHLFDQPFAANYWKTSDASPLMLHWLGASQGYEMWDGDGNRYAFAWPVTGYDDPPQAFLNDLGYGRNGWYLTSLSDPFGSAVAVTYYRNLGAQPCWTLSHCPTAVNSWILKNVTRGSTTLVTVNLGTDAGAPGVSNLVTSVDFAVSGGASARWTVSHGTTSVTRGDPNPPSLALVTIAALGLPLSMQYAFTWNAGGADSGYGGLLKTMTLPTGGVISYYWGGYGFYHGRTASLSINCAPLGPPNDAAVKQSGRPATGVKTNGPDPADFPEPAISGNDCSPQNPDRWLDTVKGVLRRTETVNGVDAVTDYAQWAFPFGEQGTASNNLGPQTLTLVTEPADVDGHRNAVGTLFWGAPAGSSSGGGSPGGRVGADIRTARYDTDPYPGLILPFPQPLCGGAADALCVTHSIRVVQRTFEYDDSSSTKNRRLKSETTYFDNTNADGSCPGCAYHGVLWSNTGSNTWEGNGRHYDLETHTGNLGGDARSITTSWAPENWTAPPGPGETVLSGLVNRRTETEGSSTTDRYDEHDTATGFLEGTFVYDAGRDIVFLDCRYADGAGNLEKEFTKTFSSSVAPSRTYCSDNYPSFPSSVGQDSDLFGKAYTSQNGERLTARWINGSTATATFRIKDLTRDPATGWITASRDTAGLASNYGYDALGRVTLVDPPGADLSTFVCYDGPTATTAYRASAAQTCPVAASNSAIATWEHYDDDGLGRTIRERRLLPAGAISKRFTLYDGAGHAAFASEWVADGTSEAVAKDLATTCALASGATYAAARPSAAPGTFRLCFDPFARPRQIVGSKHSSLETVDRTDGSSPYSQTLETVKTSCVNATFSNLQQATCNTGGLNPQTTTRRDAFGRITAVTEPSGESTAYQYDVNGKLARVDQGAQGRAFEYDAAGFLRKETTPEQGTVSYGAIGSLGNVRQETRPGSVAVVRTYDFAGRLATQTAGGNTYLVNCYDGAACLDGSPGYAGGSFPAGRLTRRYGYNWIPTPGPTVDEEFEYGDGAGRLSKVVTNVGNGDLAVSASQTWTYGSLGLPATHGHPRATGSFPVAFSYGQGLVSTISGNGQTVVAATTWNPASGLASWKAGNAGTPVTTTIVQDASLLPRPASISNSLWSSGAYTYDGDGNILKIGSDAFAYDSRSRLLSAKYGSTTRAFAYDRFGNLTQNGASIAIDPATNHVTSGSAVYDPSGDMIAYNGESMAYDLLDRQYRNTNASGDWAFLFNGAGERVVKFPAKASVLRREMARYIAEANVFAKGWTLPACANTFSDVACSDPDARQVQLVYNKGITGGCGTNPLRYCPDDTLTRAQMAVFLVKGYKPDGFTPPACQGIFTDVACSGPYATFAPWIEQMYRDGVTGGCSASPLQFCPGSTVGQWEVLVWLAKAPGATAGSFFWSAYRPVPRGSIYTLRDDQNRIVTEMAGGSTGSSTATLSVTRDNVFLGNLLVASYVASPAGWQYTASDHLGSPRVVFDQNGQLVESHKHWPYGEDTNAIPPLQRLAYCLMEKEDGATRLYDHARTHDHGLGRFLSPDKVTGQTRNPQSWNRYVYGANNPVKMVDPDGRWPRQGHERIIDAAFPGLPAALRLYIKAGSAAVDRLVPGQGNGHAYEHAMRAPKQSVSEARQKAATFYAQELNTAKGIQAIASRNGQTEISGEALTHFGAASHPVADETSPKHEGFQVWNWANVFSVLGHAAGEEEMSPERLTIAVQALRAMYAEAFGIEAMERAVRQPSGSGCNDSPTGCNQSSAGQVR